MNFGFRVLIEQNKTVGDMDIEFVLLLSNILYTQKLTVK